MLYTKSIFICFHHPVSDLRTGNDLRMTEFIVLITAQFSSRCLMQPLVPFVVLLSCSVSFILPEKLLSVWTLTVDLGLSSGASAGEVSL